VCVERKARNLKVEKPWEKGARRKPALIRGKSSKKKLARKKRSRGVGGGGGGGGGAQGGAKRCCKPPKKQHDRRRTAIRGKGGEKDTLPERQQHLGSKKNILTC